MTALPGEPTVQAQPPVEKETPIRRAYTCPTASGPTLSPFFQAKALGRLHSGTNKQHSIDLSRNKIPRPGETSCRLIKAPGIATNGSGGLCTGCRSD